MKDKVLLIVSVIEGRHFPSNPDGDFLVEVIFGGESLSTDPVRTSVNPKFDAELAWELDKQGLKLHRLQRSPVKLNCYLCNSRGKKENMGYLVLDIREAKENGPQNRWCRLLNSKYDKPELLIGLYFEHEGDRRHRDVEPLEPTSEVIPQRNPDVHPQPTILSVPKVKGSFSSEQLKPKLNSNESYYQIGPLDRCTDFFALSVTLVFAENLNQLPHGSTSNSVKQDFSFTYQLLGNSVTTETFHDLTTAEFPAERATVRIRSNLDALFSYFKKEPGLHIQLVRDCVPIASTVVHLENLIEMNKSGNFKDEMKVDGVFQLGPASSDRQPEPSGISAAIGVSVGLQREVRDDNVKVDEMESEQQSSSTSCEVEENNNNGLHVQEATINLTDNSSVNEVSQSKSNGSRKEQPVDVRDAVPTALRNSKPGHHKTTDGLPKGKEPLRPNGRNPQNGSIEAINTNSHSKASNLSSHADVEMPIHNGRPKAENNKENGTSGQKVPVLQNGSISTINSRIGLHSDNLQVHHRFHFILDLKSLQMGPHVKPFDCFLRYSYPFFGTSTAILTHPAIRVSPNTNLLLPHGYCSFDFLTSLQNIRGTFQNIPLMVEVLEEIPGDLDGRIVGLCKLCLHPVLESQSSKSTDPNGTTSVRRSISSKVPIVSPDGKNVGELKIVAGLDDFGEADISEVLTKPIKYNSGPNASIQQIYKNSTVERMNARAENGQMYTNSVVEAMNRPTSGDNSSENRLLHMVMELEVWKEQQEVLFRNQLKTRESEHLQTLTAEWKQRDLERELLVQRNLQECKQHEEKLKTALTDIEVRERQLAVSESDLRSKRTEMALHFQKVKDEAKDNIRRIKMECDYKVELENKRCTDLLQEKQNLKLQIAERDKKLKERDHTIESLHKRIQGTSEIKLQAELEILNIEKGELNRKLEVVTSAKNRYKEQWGKALKQISSLQQQLNSLEKNALSNRLDMLHSVPKSVTVDEQNTLEHEKRALAKIKEEVDFLKRRMHNQSDSQSFNSSGQSVPDAGSGVMFPLHTPTSQSAASGSRFSSKTVADGYVHQLLGARDILLNTGVYSKSDRIVSELEKHIEESTGSCNS